MLIQKGNRVLKERNFIQKKAATLIDVTAGLCVKRAAFLLNVHTIIYLL